MTEAVKKEVKRFQSRQRVGVLHFKKKLGTLTSKQNNAVLVRSGILTIKGKVSPIYRTAKAR